MNTRHILVAALATVLILSSVRNATARHSVVADVPFERAFGGIPFVAVSVNGSGPLQFMIDTGGAGSIIDQDVAARLRLQTVQGRASVSGNAALEVGVVPSATIRIGKATLATRLTVHSMAGLEPAFGRPIHGILGGDFFQRYVVELNYDRNRFAVYDRYNVDRAFTPVPLELSNGVPFVNLTVVLGDHAGLSGSFLIDSAGGWMTIHVHREIAEREKIRSITGLAETGLGLGGATNRRVVRGTSLVVGPYRLTRPPVAITEDTAGLRTNASSLGLVGVEVLRKFNLVFDYAKKRLYLKPNRAFSSPLRHDASGLRLQSSAPGFSATRIVGVVPSSPAAQAGFERGDTILTVNGRNVAHGTLEELREAFREPDKHFAVRVRRGEQVLSLRLATREML